MQRVWNMIVQVSNRKDTWQRSKRASIHDMAAVMGSGLPCCSPRAMSASARAQHRVTGAHTILRADTGSATARL